jgi:predicted ATPase
MTPAKVKGQMGQSVKNRTKEERIPVAPLSTLRIATEAEAEACFHEAISIAQKQRAKSLELRATISLARLWQQQGKRAEAHRKLAKIYKWFTEGFGTRDLQDAKALLHELHPSK